MNLLISDPILRPQDERSSCFGTAGRRTLRRPPVFPSSNGLSAGSRLYLVNSSLVSGIFHWSFRGCNFSPSKRYFGDGRRDRGSRVHFSTTRLSRGSTLLPGKFSTSILGLGHESLIAFSSSSKNASWKIFLLIDDESSNNHPFRVADPQWSPTCSSPPSGSCPQPPGSTPWLSIWPGRCFEPEDRPWSCSKPSRSPSTSLPWITCGLCS